MRVQKWGIFCHLEVGLPYQVGHRGAVVEVEVCDQGHVDLIQLHLIQEWQRPQARVPWVDPAVEHHPLAPVTRSGGGCGVVGVSVAGS